MLTKQEWIDRCAKRFVERAALEIKQAKEMAEVSFDQAVENERSEAKALTSSPEDACDEELTYWVG